MTVTFKRVASMLVVLAMFVSAMVGCSTGADDDTAATTTTAVTTTVTTTTTQHAVLDASDVIVRDGPGFDYEAIGGISYQEDIVIIGREGDWFKIQFGDGVGYINAQYVNVDGEPNASEMKASLPTVTTTTAPVMTDASGNIITTTAATDANGNVITTQSGTVTEAANGAVAIPTAEPGVIPETVVTDAF